MRLIVGLGNPGEKYKKTRHNAGFMALDFWAKEQNLEWENNKKLGCEIIKNQDLVFIKPLCFMNNSGQIVEKALNYFDLMPKKMGVFKQKNADLSELLTVVHDDLDLELGSYKVSIDSRSAGHNGVQSIINHLKTKNFKRIRIGINSERPEQMAGKDFVLQKFSPKQQEKLDSIFKQIDFQK